jgi:RNA polymerase sigma-70 factor (ECF subfamily)
MSDDRKQFARVYADHVWRVYAFIAYRVRDRHVAEDLTQATFERALRAWPRFDRRKASEATWLLAIARNLMIDHHRRDRSDPTPEVDERLLPATSGPEEGLGIGAELAAALGRLSERDREVVALRFAGDLTGAEIAAALDLTLANVQQILSRALRKLRAELEALDGTGGEEARSRSG